MPTLLHCKSTITLKSITVKCEIRHLSSNYKMESYRIPAAKDFDEKQKTETRD